MDFRHLDGVVDRPHGTVVAGRRGRSIARVVAWEFERQEPPLRDQDQELLPSVMGLLRHEHARGFDAKVWLLGGSTRRPRERLSH